MINHPTIRPALKHLLLPLALAFSLALTGQAQAGQFKIVRVAGSNSITLSSWSHWAMIKTNGMLPDQWDPIVKGLVAIPPNFKGCIKGLQHKGQSRKQATLTCWSLFAGVNHDVMQMLIQRAWIRGEAKQRGVGVSQARVLAQYNRTKKEAFPDEAAFKKFLRQSGQTPVDLQITIKISMLQELIRADVTKGLNQEQAQAAMDRFVPAFTKKWTARTTCDRDFGDPRFGEKVKECGHLTR